MKEKKISAPSEEQGNISAVSRTDSLSETEIQMLKIVAEGNVYSISECYDRMGVNQRQGNETKNQLIDKGFVKVIKLPKLSDRGRRPMTIALTERGIREARKLCLKIVPEDGRKGGPLYRYLINLIANEFKKHYYKLEVEKSIGEGKSVDIVVNDRIAVEVETGESYFSANIEKLVEARFE